MSWFEKLSTKISRISGASKKEIPEGLWSKCSACDAMLFKQELDRNLNVCPKCSHHLRLSARERLALMSDEVIGEIGEHVVPADKLKFKDSKRYRDRLTSAQKQTGEKDAFVAAKVRIADHELVMGAFEFNFIGGSMGSVVGERFRLAAKVAAEERIPMVVFACSGGARMQESLTSLMQMAKTASALALLRNMNIPFISVMVDPCMGGVSASFATLGDINLAEPRALIGFAGPRVIEQIVREQLPEGFQRSEFLLEKGHIDKIVDRREMKDTIYRLLKKFYSQWPQVNIA